MERSPEQWENAEEGHLFHPGIKGVWKNISLKDEDKPRRDDYLIVSPLIKSVNEILPGSPRGYFLASLDYDNK